MDWSDFCIVVSGEEIQADLDFQCSYCGLHNSPASPKQVGNELVRTCPACGVQRKVRSWSRELPNGKFKVGGPVYAEL